MTKRITLQFVRGDGPQYRFWLQDPETEDLVPLTGYRIWMTAKYSLSDLDQDAVFQLRLNVDQDDGGIELIDDDLRARLTIPANATENFPDKDIRLFADIRYRAPLDSSPVEYDQPRTPFLIDFVVSPGVTKET